jgi:peptidylprolyl isomerase domain and WD repeat-containing protein 1
LYELKKSKGIPSSLEFSPDGQYFVTYGLIDRIVRVWKFSTGKLYRKYDESLQVISEMQQAGTAAIKLDDMEFGRRLAAERELETNLVAKRAANAIFDASGSFVLYATLIGIKVVNFRANKVSAIIGGGETPRFLHLALYQGAPGRKKVVTLAMASAENPTLADTQAPDPTVICSAYKRNRFYLFSRRDPMDLEGGVDVSSGSIGRDVFNEKPTKEEQTVATIRGGRAAQASQATLHTTMGDIVINLFPDHTPKTVENFVTHSRNNYYNGHLFHRVIKNFMIQTGDPKGDGTGGESCWGGEFEDEIVGDLRHDRAGTVSMANAGPSTYFILLAISLGSCKIISFADLCFHT